MKNSLPGFSLFFILFAFMSSCNDQKTTEENKVKDGSQTNSPSTPSNQDTSAVSLSASDSSGQNYTFSTSGDLQIVGDEYKYDIILPTDVLFDFDKSTLRPKGDQLLQKVKAHFQKNKTDQVHIWGHTDSKGSDQYNFVLSQKRAKAVCDWLNKEVGGFNMCIGRGETEPLVPNENADGSDNTVNRQKNRRVTISVVKYPDVNKMLDKAKKQGKGL